MARTTPLNGEELRRRILRMREARVDWEAISLEIGIPASDCQAIARGETEITLEEPSAGNRAAELVIRRNMVGREGIVILISSLGIARTGKTTLAMELGALCASRGARVALVDADVIGHGLYHATLPEAGDLQGLLAWEPDASQVGVGRRGGWPLPGSSRRGSEPVDVWAMPPNVKREPEEAWASRFWQWARATYAVTIVDSGESVPSWAEFARQFADQTLYVLPQDLIAVADLSLSAPRGTAGMGAVVMGYSENPSKLLRPERIANMLGLPLLAAIPYDSRFANWQIVNSVPWFPAQANSNLAITKEFENLLPQAFREQVQPVKRRWPR